MQSKSFVNSVSKSASKLGRKIINALLSKFLISMYVVAFFTGIGTVVFCHLENWPYFDGLYFSILALTTVHELIVHTFPIYHDNHTLNVEMTLKDRLW